MKPSLNFPTSKEEWHAADLYFRNDLWPLVQASESIDHMNQVLSDGVYDYFARTYGTRKGLQNNKKYAKHERALKTVTNLKNNARRDFRKAKREGFPPNAILAVARNFFKLVRQHSSLKKKSQQASLSSAARKARQRCYKNFWRFAKDLLDDNNAARIVPQFPRETAQDHFTSTYQSQPREYVKPSWMPLPKLPTSEFDTAEISLEEISRVIRKCKTSSSPSPLDQVPYKVFKRCPSLSYCLKHLFNLCWISSSVPAAWKSAVIKLIGKSSASVDPTLPSNFRPIALTSCIGKIYTSILRDRWLAYMLENSYLDPSIQKGFMPATPGCIEHHSKLSTTIYEARNSHKSLAVCWLDLANAYGSVHHSLIQYSFCHYHAPPQFLASIQALYSNLSATVVSQDWSTSNIPLQLGVYQGDPFSVVVFNTVINTMVDTIHQRLDLGYTITNTSHTINLLQYADDACIIAKDPASCQHLLKTVEQWLQWTGMRAKVPKCHSFAIQSSTGKIADPRLTLSGQQIPSIGNESIKFLGLTIEVPKNTNRARAEIKNRLLSMLQLVDQSGVTRLQKLKLYKLAICPRLTWLLSIQEYPASWIEKELEGPTTKFLKQWAGLTKSATPNRLYLPKQDGGLNLPSVSSLYKCLQCSRQCQLLTSSDPTVRRIAEDNLQLEIVTQRKMFKPAVMVRDTMIDDPSFTRKTLRVAAKRKCREEDDTTRRDHLLSLPRQGELSRTATPASAKAWAEALVSLPPEPFKFASHDTLPHNSNLCLWKKKSTPFCPLCGEQQTLLHVLNACKTALHLRRYNERHDRILSELHTTIKQNLPPSTSITSDLEDYRFPHHIVSTDLRPDIVCWDELQKIMWLVELTIPYETGFQAAANRKQEKYLDLQESVERAGYKSHIITIEVGSRGLVNPTGFEKLALAFNIKDAQLKHLFTTLSREAILGSHRIWCSRNKQSTIT